MRTLKFVKGCKIEMIKDGDRLVMKRKGKKCPSAQQIIDSVKNDNVIIK